MSTFCNLKSGLLLYGELVVQGDTELVIDVVLMRVGHIRSPPYVKSIGHGCHIYLSFVRIGCM